MCRSKTSLLEATVKRQQNRATWFATLPQNVLKAMMRVLPPSFKPVISVLQQIKVAASCLNTDFWLYQITRESCHVRDGKSRNMYRFVAKVELFSSFYNNFWQPATTWFVARRVWTRVILTTNIALQLILRQFCHIVLPYLKLPIDGFHLTSSRSCWCTEQ